MYFSTVCNISLWHSLNQSNCSRLLWLLTFNLSAIVVNEVDKLKCLFPPNSWAKNDVKSSVSSNRHIVKDTMHMNSYYHGDMIIDKIIQKTSIMKLVRIKWKKEVESQNESELIYRQSLWVNNATRLNNYTKKISNSVTTKSNYWILDDLWPLVFHSYFCVQRITQWNLGITKPLYNKFVGITNHFLYHSNSKTLLKRTLKYRSLLTENKICQSLGSSVYRGSIVTPKLRAVTPGIFVQSSVPR